MGGECVKLGTDKLLRWPTLALVDSFTLAALMMRLALIHRDRMVGRMICHMLACWLLLWPTLVSELLADERLLENGDVVLFIGDSITQAGDYITQVEAYLLTARPQEEFVIRNHGRSSETVAGTSEPDHPGRRPWVLDRFTRDVASHKPNVLIACYGMNDGNYHPFDWYRFEKYQAGMRQLIERAEKEAKVRQLVLMTPPPFDASRRQVSDPDAINYGYKFAAPNYDDALNVYSEWLMALKTDELPVVDLHSAIGDAVRSRRLKKASFHVAPDAVHPNATGHWLIAAELLAELGEGPPAQAIQLQPDEQGNLETSALLAIPVPHHPDVDGELLAAYRSEGLFAGLFLQLLGAYHGTAYELLVDGQAAGIRTGAIWEEGVDLAEFPELDLVKQSQTLYEKLASYRQRASAAWREAAFGDKPMPDEVAERLKTERAEILKLRQPRLSKLQLVKVGG